MAPERPRAARTRSHRELTLIGWIAAALAAVGVAGLALLPQAGLAWIVLLVFAVSAIPQALLRRRAEGKRRAEGE